MSAIESILRDCALPPLVPVVCRYEDDGIRDVHAAVHVALDASPVAPRLPEGGEIAIGVGSRGIARLPDLVRGTVDWFRARGTRPFIIPCMGSHGGATPRGQTGVLAELGVTEDSAGAPIRSSMDVCEVGRLADGMPVYMDALAHAADGIFVINRVKPHPTFSGVHESGLVKMLTIGLGKQRGADSCHVLGFGAFGAIMPAMSTLILERKKSILGGLATVENAYDQPCLIEAVPAEKILSRDAELLLYARSRMPAIPVDQADVLVVDYIGKNISGSGMDPNITGRHATNLKQGGPAMAKVAVLDLTPQTGGNATGMGNADIITRRMHDAIDFAYTYPNVLTSTLLRVAFTPVVMPTDEMALKCAVKTCNAGNRDIRFIRIRDTLTLDRLLVSPAVAGELENRPGCSITGPAAPMRFDAAGALLERDIWDRFPGAAGHR